MMTKTIHNMITKKSITRFLMLILGNALDAFGVGCFILPMGFIVSGASGIGRVLWHYMGEGFPVSRAIAFVNVALFIIALVCMGKRFAGTIIVGTFAFPFFLDIYEHISWLNGLTNDPVVAMLCGSICSGVGMGIVIRAGGSTGGADVIPIILHARKNWSITVVMYVLDCIILLLQIPFASKEEIVLGILAELACVITLDKALVAGGGETQFMIYSRQWREINKKLLTMDVGTTLLHGEGGFYGRPEEVICCIVSSRKMHEIKEAILDIDPVAFMTVTQVEEVSGRGFSLEKKYANWEKAAFVEAEKAHGKNV